MVGEFWLQRTGLALSSPVLQTQCLAKCFECRIPSWQISEYVSKQTQQLSWKESAAAGGISHNGRTSLNRKISIQEN
ncbi:unnamed protein product [Gulo gulo]|uniref:Uncharacterized protein n=1 Tax=Gulo gulo TaxID=48420 RepID=A0A9X9QA33_GULGU|nr:unnamed protein product [Gulo gulo]